VIVLDTHVLVWLRTSPDQLSKAAADAIRKQLKSDCVSIAAVTLWELSWLATNGRIDPGGTVPAFLKKITAGVVILPLTIEIAAQAAAFPVASYPQDPADRLIGATALTSGTDLVTKDHAIRRSSLVRTIW
jgi:PIN domain nuclease of toxin-antitoxin system